jgi:hypothetical protein
VLAGDEAGIREAAEIGYAIEDPDEMIRGAIEIISWSAALGHRGV